MHIEAGFVRLQDRKKEVNNVLNYVWNFNSRK